MILHTFRLLQGEASRKSVRESKRRRQADAGLSPFLRVFVLCLMGNVAHLFGKDVSAMWGKITAEEMQSDESNGEDARFPFDRLRVFGAALLARWTGADGSVDPWQAGRMLALIAIAWGFCCFYPTDPPFFSTSPAFVNFRYFAPEPVWGAVVLSAGVGKLLALRSGNMTALFWASLALQLFYVFAAMCYMGSGYAEYARFGTLLFGILALCQIRMVIATVQASPSLKEQIAQSAITNDWKRFQEWNRKRRESRLKDSSRHDVAIGRSTTADSPTDNTADATEDRQPPGGR